MAKASTVVPVVALLSGLVGFLLGREVFPRQPDVKSRTPTARALPHPAERPPRPAPWRPATGEPDPGPEKPEAEKKTKTTPRTGQPQPVVYDYPPIAVTDPKGAPQRRQEGRFVDGKRHGSWRELFPDGSVAWRQEYDRGVPIGTFTRYHKNGRVAEEGPWRDGRKDGRWLRFDELGTLVREETFDRGKLAEPIRLWGFPEAPAKKSTVGGKYGGLLLAKIADPDAKASYTEFRDYGTYQETDYMGHKKVARGYWVYVYPYWYVWSDKLR